LWIDLKKSKELAELQKEVSLLFNIKKEYRPHITLARIKKLEKNERCAILEAVKKTKIQEITIEVKNFKLYSSELTVLGPVHRVIEYFGATSIKEKNSKK
jgi:2'-5' RNA ligase